MNWERVYERWERKVKAQGLREGGAKVKAEGKAEGEAKGKAEAVLAVLEGRGLAVTATQKKQVLACSTIAQLDAWLRAAGTTESTKALLSSSARSTPRPARIAPAA